MVTAKNSTFLMNACLSYCWLVERSDQSVMEKVAQAIPYFSSIRSTSALSCGMVNTKSGVDGKTLHQCP